MAAVTANGKGVHIQAPVQLQPIRFEEIEVPIEGVTPLIQNRFAEKARQQMLAKQMGATRQKKPPKEPERDYQAAMYCLDDGRPGHPATAFKAATVDAARFFDGLTMEDLKRCVFIFGEGEEQLVPLLGEPSMREDTTRNETGVADIRFRPQFWPWSAVLSVRYNAIKLTADAVVNLIDAGGQSSGVGEWRPGSKKARNGSFGMYQVSA